MNPFVLVRRTYDVYTADCHKTVQCPNPENALSATDNIVSEVYYTSGTSTVLRRVRPDATVIVEGTPVTNLDSSQNPVSVTTTTDEGEYSGGAVVNGIRTIETKGLTGALLSRLQYRISNGSQGSDIIHKELYDLDEFSRPRRVDYLGDLYKTMTYSCCGLATEVGTDGVTTTYVYDALGRLATTTKLGSLRRECSMRRGGWRSSAESSPEVRETRFACAESATTRRGWSSTRPTRWVE